MSSHQFAILLDGGFVVKKPREAPETGDRRRCRERVFAICATAPLANLDLLRIYYYDAPPSDESVTKPISGSASSAGTTRFREAQSLYDTLDEAECGVADGGDQACLDKWRLTARSVKDLEKTLAHSRTRTSRWISARRCGPSDRLGHGPVGAPPECPGHRCCDGRRGFHPEFKFVRREGVKVILDTLGHKTRGRPEGTCGHCLLRRCSTRPSLTALRSVFRSGQIVRMPNNWLGWFELDHDPWHPPQWFCDVDVSTSRGRVYPTTLTRFPT